MLFVPHAVSRSREDDLGPRRALFRRARPANALPGLAALAALPVSGLSVLLAFTVAPGAALVPPLVLLAVLAWAWVHRPQWLAIYEQGVAYCRGAISLSARWEDVLQVTGGGDSATLTLAGTTLNIAGWPRQAVLVAMVNAEVAPRALARARGTLATDGRADFPPLAIFPDRLELTRSGAAERLPLPDLIGSAYEGGTLKLEIIASSRERGTWFQLPVTNAIAAGRFLEEVRSAAASAASAENAAQAAQAASAVFGGELGAALFRQAPAPVPAPVPADVAEEAVASDALADLEKAREEARIHALGYVAVMSLVAIVIAAGSVVPALVVAAPR